MIHHTEVEIKDEVTPQDSQCTVEVIEALLGAVSGIKTVMKEIFQPTSKLQQIKGPPTSHFAEDNTEEAHMEMEAEKDKDRVGSNKRFHGTYPVHVAHKI